MIDSASIIAIAEKTKDVLDQGQNLLPLLTGAVLALVGFVGYIIGLVKGKKDSAKPEETQK